MRARIRRMLANAAGEYYRIGPSHSCQESADVLPRPIAKDLNRQKDSAIIVFSEFLFQHLHIVRKARDSQQSGLGVQESLHLVWRESFLDCDEVDERRVHIARARAHHQPPRAASCPWTCPQESALALLMGGFANVAPLLRIHSQCLREGEVKTEYSRDYVPLDPALVGILLEHRERCYPTPERWLFANPATNRPYHQDTIQQNHIREAGKKAGLGDGIGWKTFRHSYRSWMDDTGAPLTVQKELMRHANIQTTMNVYGKAMTDTKRNANSKVVEMILKPKAALDGGPAEPVLAIGS